MMARPHILSGAVLWLGAAPALARLAGVELDAPTLAAGTVVCAGAALLPDLDHEDGTLAGALGLPTEALTRLVARLSGGHRHATHSLLFAAAAAAGSWALVTYASRWATLALALALTAAAARALDLNATAGWPRAWAIATAVTALEWWRLPEAWPWLPLAVGLGCLAHLAGDWLTPEGVPLLWPWAVRLELPLIDVRTDHFAERRIVTPALGLGLAALAWAHFAAPVWGRWF